MEENIAIIILNYCNYNLSEECVNNLIKLGIKSKIVIVDNNSTNNSYEYLEEKFKYNEKVHVIKNSINAGYAAGNNFGIRYILEKDKDIEYISIMNPDVIISYRELFSNLVDKLKKNENIAAIAGMKVEKKSVDFHTLYWNIPTNMELLFEHCNFTSAYFYKKNNIRTSLSPDREGTARVEIVPGCFFIIKRSVLEEIGLFDEGTFLYNEENILAIELKKRGYTEAISINDFYLHNHNPSIGLRTLKQWYNLSKVNYTSRQYLCSKYERKNMLLFLLWVIQKINYLEITLRYMGSLVKRKLKKR